MQAKIYNQKGEESGKIDLPENIFNLKPNADLVHQVALAMSANSRAGTADTKGIGEVRGGGKKPWKQKGTGRARHGSTRSPIWKGGGTTHGPLAEKSYKQKINKKMRVKALCIVLSTKFKNKEIIFIDKLDLKEMKTKEASGIISSLGKITGFGKISRTKKPVGVITLPVKDDKTKKSFRNLPQIDVQSWKDLSILDILSKKYLLIVSPEDSFSFLKSRLEK